VHSERVPQNPPVLRRNPRHTGPSRAPREDPLPRDPSPTVDRARRVAQPPTSITSGVRAPLLPFCCPTSGVHDGGQELPRTTSGVVIGQSNHGAAPSRICRHFEDGSDGTRTRDLRRDRPLHPALDGRRPIHDRTDHKSFRARARPSLIVPVAGSGRLLPVCCPARRPWEVTLGRLRYRATPVPRKYFA
jgi:hypothetical protein